MFEAYQKSAPSTCGGASVPGTHGGPRMDTLQRKEERAGADGVCTPNNLDFCAAAKRLRRGGDKTTDRSPRANGTQPVGDL